MNAVAGSSTAMNAVAGSSTAMNAVAGSSTAMNAVGKSDVGVIALANSNLSRVNSSTDKINGTKLIFIGSTLSSTNVVDATTPNYTSKLNSTNKRAVSTKYGTMYVCLDVAPVTFTYIDDWNQGKIIYISL